MLKACFILTSPRHWISARIRAEWIAEHIPFSRVIDFGKEPLPEAENYVWVKAVNRDTVKNTPGRHWWDLCDPAWWWSPDIKVVAGEMAGVVCSCQALADDFTHSMGIPALVVKDRIKLEHYPLRRSHCEAHPVRFVWFGASQNRVALFGAVANLERLTRNGVKIELTICDDRPGDVWQITEDFPIYYAPWSLDRENVVYAAHDIVLLPPYPGPWGRVKSNNKTLTAWACGLPVTDGFDYDELLDLALFPKKRGSIAQIGLYELESEYTADKSAEEWLQKWQG